MIERQSNDSYLSSASNEFIPFIIMIHTFYQYQVYGYDLVLFIVSFEKDVKVYGLIQFKLALD